MWEMSKKRVSLDSFLSLVLGVNGGCVIHACCSALIESEDCRYQPELRQTRIQMWMQGELQSSGPGIGKEEG